jgi:hypothetical protein
MAALAPLQIGFEVRRGGVSVGRVPGHGAIDGGIEIGRHLREQRARPRRGRSQDRLGQAQAVFGLEGPASREQLEQSDAPGCKCRRARPPVRR